MEQADAKKTFSVLIAEDDHALGILVERTLQQAGFMSHRVYNGKETLEFCTTHSPENTILLLDYQLGDYTAKEIVRRLKEKNRIFPFIVMTGYGNENVAVEMMKLGAEDYLTKGPSSTELLIPVLSQTIDRLIFKQSLEQSQLALRTAHQAIMAAENGVLIARISHEDCPIIYYNPAFGKITGYQYTSNPTLNEWLNSYDQQQLGLQEIRSAIQQRRSAQIQLKRTEPSVSQHEVSLSFIPETSNQDAVCIGIVTDTTQKYLDEQEISQLRQQLEQIQRLAIAGQIAKELAHEIGHPLTLMSSKIQFMVNKDTAHKEELYAILQHIDRINNLLRRFSRNETEMLSLTFVSIHSMIQSILHLHHSNDNISIAVDVPENLPRICADKAKISQVLLNLITNALEACQKSGTIFISASVKPDLETNKKYMAISIKDTGRGIAPEHLDKIFEPFYSTKSSSLDRGLGLTICQNIAKQHQGWIEVISPPGEGACFTLMLPLAAVMPEHIPVQTMDHTNP